jgi:hypothetical protein
LAWKPFRAHFLSIALLIIYIYSLFITCCSKQNVDIAVMEDPSKYYNDFVGVRLSVPCKTWDAAYALKCFGEDFESKSVEGVIVKAKSSRSGKKPRFDVQFPDKPGEKLYVNFDLDYILKYSEEVPLKYHTLKADYIVRLSEEVRSQITDEAFENLFHEEEVPSQAVDEEEVPSQFIFGQNGQFLRMLKPVKRRLLLNQKGGSGLQHVRQRSKHGLPA